MISEERQKRRIARLQKKIDQRPDVEVSLSDSMMAGNCESGTRAFVNLYFPGRTSVMLAELKAHLSNEEWEYNVITAVIFKLRQIGVMSPTEEI